MLVFSHPGPAGSREHDQTEESGANTPQAQVNAYRTIHAPPEDLQPDPECRAFHRGSAHRADPAAGVSPALEGWGTRLCCGMNRRAVPASIAPSLLERYLLRGTGRSGYRFGRRACQGDLLEGKNSHPERSPAVSQHTYSSSCFRRNSLTCLDSIQPRSRSRM